MNITESYTFTALSSWYAEFFRRSSKEEEKAIRESLNCVLIELCYYGAADHAPLSSPTLSGLHTEGLMLSTIRFGLMKGVAIPAPCIKAERGRWFLPETITEDLYLADCTHALVFHGVESMKPGLRAEVSGNNLRPDYRRIIELDEIARIQDGARFLCEESDCMMTPGNLANAALGKPLKANRNNTRGWRPKKS